MDKAAEVGMEESTLEDVAILANSFEATGVHMDIGAVSGDDIHTRPIHPINTSPQGHSRDNQLGTGMSKSSFYISSV